MKLHKLLFITFCFLNFSNIFCDSVSIFVHYHDFNKTTGYQLISFRNISQIPSIAHLKTEIANTIGLNSYQFRLCKKVDDPTSIDDSFDLSQLKSNNQIVLYAIKPIASH